MRQTSVRSLSATWLPTKPPPIAPTTVATVWPVPPPIRLPRPPPISAPPIVPTAVFMFCTESCWMDSTVPTRPLWGWVTSNAGGVLHPASASAATAASTATERRSKWRWDIIGLLRKAARSLGDRIEQEHRGEQARRAAEPAQPLLEDHLDVRGQIDLGERGVHLAPERRIVARQREGVGLVRELLGEQREARRILHLRGDPDQLDLVAG